ncbi:MAG: histidine ammonia-lyase [Flavobacteriales bacterium]|nr:histidine ammonia-lyase [Flavobacteriales bacterium]MCB9192703.1 histidine ammonia-lyase [Flavobacteriales bacterium]MCB9205198.1 histidine ammonia-lyase [Flavobacteriales bacterium]
MDRLTIANLSELLGSGNLDIWKSSLEKIERSSTYLEERLGRTKETVYGVNTGFGSLSNIRIEDEGVEELQSNLILSHACGTGKRVPDNIVRAMLCLKVWNMLYGNSGVQKETVLRLVDHFNNDVLPVIYTQGSLGASGDLAPLAHLCLPLIGEGNVILAGKEVPSKDALEFLGWKPLQLKMKEGLALLNGTQFMSAYGAYSVFHAERLGLIADLIGAIALDAYGGLTAPFDPSVHAVRPHPGQIESARRLRTFLEESPLANEAKDHIQDPYSFRCMPQVHGASLDAIEHVKQVVERELNSVSDNPLIFPEEDKIISAGNFHGQPLAINYDYLSIALAELANISERRTFQLIMGKNGLPVYLVKKPGLHSGFMIPQYTSAGIVSQNKQLCSPASVDSIVSSNGQEDHVSMGANAATKLYEVVENVYQVLAIELFTAAQALDFRRPKKSSPVIESFIEEYRKLVPFLHEDEQMHPHMVNTKNWLMTVELPNV